MKNETEDLFEAVRKESFPYLPSRKSVLFVLPYDNTFVKGWVAQYSPHNDYALLTLRLTGTIIWCEENNFTYAGISPSHRKVNAMKYWEDASDDFNKFEIPEGLFRGIDTITETVSYTQGQEAFLHLFANLLYKSDISFRQCGRT